MRIEASTVVEGLHCWPEAPDRRGYLRHPHRHLFHITAVLDVTGEHHAVEFHDLADQLHQLATQLASPYHPDARVLDFGPTSCEVIANHVAAGLQQAGHSPRSVTVSEDREHAAIWHA